MHSERLEGDEEESEEEKKRWKKKEKERRRHVPHTSRLQRWEGMWVVGRLLLPWSGCVQGKQPWRYEYAPRLRMCRLHYERLLRLVHLRYQLEMVPRKKQCQQIPPAGSLLGSSRPPWQAYDRAKLNGCIGIVLIASNPSTSLNRTRATAAFNHQRRADSPIQDVQWAAQVPREMERFN